MRLLERMVPANPSSRDHFRLENTPTRFGRVTLDLEPLASNGWKLETALEPAQHPSSVEIPVSMNGRQFERVVGASFQINGGRVRIDPSARKWTAFWQ